MENIVNVENLYLLGGEKGTPEYEVRKVQEHVLVNLLAQENLLIQSIKNFGLDKPEDELFAGLDPLGLEYTANQLLPIFVRAEMLADASRRQLRWIDNEKYDLRVMSEQTRMNHMILWDTCIRFSGAYVKGYYQKVRNALNREFSR